LKVEKVVPGKAKGVVRIGPLKPAVIRSIWRVFMRPTAKGVVIAE